MYSSHSKFFYPIYYFTMYTVHCTVHTMECDMQLLVMQNADITIYVSYEAYTTSCLFITNIHIYHLYKEYN